MARDPQTVQSRKRTILRLAAIAFMAIAVTAEERYSWNLTNTDAATVMEEGVYLRVETIVPEDLGAVHAAPSDRPPVP